MSRAPSRLVPFIFLLLAVWVIVFWAWKPHGGGGAITRDPGGPGAFDRPADLAGENLPPPQPAVAVRAPEPAPPAPVPPAPLAPLRLGERFGDSGGDAQPRLVPPQFDEYTLIAGDTSFTIISKRLFDTIVYADAIAASNPFTSPDRLKPGVTLRIPRDPANIQGKIAGSSPHAVPGDPAPEIHTVQEGETLSAISKQHYGTAILWKRILDANKATLPIPEKLKPGMQLTIPPKD